MQFFTRDQRSVLLAGSLPAAIESPVPDGTAPSPTVAQVLSREQSFAYLRKHIHLSLETNLPNSPNAQTLFLSLDIEGGGRHGERLNEVGVSLFNTCSLNSTSTEAESAIVSYNFRLQSKSGYVKHSNDFLFGTTEKTPLDQTKDLFHRIVLGGQHPNPLYENDGIEIYLIGHHITGDMQIMDRYISGIWQNAPITAVTDLQVLHGGRKLCRILDNVNLEKGKRRGLHCDGNDANYSLRALLLTTVNYSVSNNDGNSTDHDMIERSKKLL